MHVHLTDAMLAALRETPEIPDNLLARVNGARKDGGQPVMTLSEDEAMAMTEMCGWYIRKDPTTGQLGEKAKLFQAIVDAIDRAGGA
jgi:hypothetical protein